MKNELLKSRLRPHKIGLVKADVVTCGTTAGKLLEADVFLSLSDNDGGTVVCAVPTENVSDLARATLQIAQFLSASGTPEAKGIPRVTAINDVSQWTSGLRGDQVALEFCVGSASVALVFDRGKLQQTLLAGMMASKGKAQ